METQVRTPNAIFGQPQRFLVPLFQRPYVWNEEQQWEPLWRDLERVSVRLLNGAHRKHQPHFLGAVVLQQVQTRVGELQARIIIDGQQRLTTLQILLDALHAELLRISAAVPAGRLEYLIENDSRFCRNEEDRYKVWPTNRDRPAFNEVMSAPYPVDYSKLKYQSARLVEAHRFFSERAREWLNSEDEEQRHRRAEVLERSARELLQLVVIDLSTDENAQEIFETLNARGAQLTAADLIKNFIFQKLLEAEADVENAYETHWKDFETAFWETEVSAGRLRYQRSSLFLNHWLISRTGEEIVAREVFSRFKIFAEHEANVPMEMLLQQISRAAHIYRRITEVADNGSGDIDRVGLFAYRIKSMESDVMKSVLLALLDQERPPVPDTIIDSTLDIIESWLTRRMLVRATTKAYNQVVAEMVGIIRQSEADRIDQALRSYLMSQTAETRYWPDDQELLNELVKMPLYRKISRSRLRMVLEAIEDHRRGYRPGGNEYAGMRVPRNTFWIEHIMPQGWEASWPPPMAAHDRGQRIHTLGNLTLLTAKLNGAVSNGPWAGENGKRAALRRHDLLLLNRDLDSFSSDEWTDESITHRTEDLIKTIIDIWPVPLGYRSATTRGTTISFHAVDLSDLLSAGLLTAGQTIVPNPQNLRHRSGQILSDGRIDIDGHIFDTPSGAGYHLRRRATNGWSFWLIDAKTKKSLASIRREYLEKSSLEATDVDYEDDDIAEEVPESPTHSSLYHSKNRNPKNTFIQTVDSVSHTLPSTTDSSARRLDNAGAMETYFVRHTQDLDIDEETREMLFESRRIAVHFPHDRRGQLPEDSTSVNSEDYEGAARRALKALQALASQGGYVCAQHLGHGQIQVGFVPPGSTIQLVNGKWGAVWGLQGRTAVLKTLTLQRVRLFEPAESVTCWERRPPRGTLMKWPSAGRSIENLVEGTTELVSNNAMSP